MACDGLATIDKTKLLTQTASTPAQESRALVVDEPSTSRPNVLGCQSAEFALDDQGLPIPIVDSALDLTGAKVQFENPEHSQIDENIHFVDVSYGNLHEEINESIQVDDVSYGNLHEEWEQIASETPRNVVQTTRKLVEKARQAVSTLGIHLQVHDPEKKLNILIMQQQLNIIEPVTYQPEPQKAKTPEEVLKLPVNNTPRARRGTKLTFGLMLTSKIVGSMEQRESGEQEAATARETAKVKKLQDRTALLDAEEELRQQRADLKAKSDKKTLYLTLKETSIILQN